MNKYALGSNIRDTLDDLGKTQTWLAEDSGITVNYISKIVCGRNMPTAVYLYKIARSLGVSMDMLMKGVVSEQNG